MQVYRPRPSFARILDSDLDGVRKERNAEIDAARRHLRDELAGIEAAEETLAAQRGRQKPLRSRREFAFPRNRWRPFAFHRDAARNAKRAPITQPPCDSPGRHRL